MSIYNVSSGQTSTGIILYYDDYMYVYDSGTANSTTVNSFGSLTISSGGTANSTTVNGFGSLKVSSGGTAGSTIINADGHMWVTKGTPLSAERLKHSSACVSGWSEDPREQFCSGLYFTIYEGEWEQYYGARFEVWFKPDKGGPERKLFEKNYRIQGWQR